jgi:hypothetical protein
MRTAVHQSRLPALPFAWLVLAITLVAIAGFSLAGMIDYKGRLEDSQHRVRGLEAEGAAYVNIAREREQALASELSSYRNQLDAAQFRERRLSARNSQSRIDLAEARALNEQLKQSFPSLSQSPSMLEEFKKKGLQDPERDIVADLMKHNELIPYEGVLGGKMCFCFRESIRVLNHKWVLAYFEDGHIMGEMLLEYAVSDDGEINWKVIDAHSDHGGPLNTD